MIPAEAVEAAAQALRDAFDWGVTDFDKQARAALEAAAPHMLAPALALHPKTCEINGDKMCNWGDECSVLVCGPCGEKWPCPTVKALLGA